MKSFSSNPPNHFNKLKYSALVAAFALSACGKESENKPALEKKPVAALGPSENPKIIMTCVVENRDDKFYVYKTSKNQYYITDSKNTDKPLKFDLLDKEISYFGVDKGEFGKDIEVAAVKHSHDGKTGWVALLSNTNARTLEVVRYMGPTDKINAAAPTIAELSEKAEVLFASINCEDGKVDGSLSKAPKKGAGDKIQERAEDIGENIEEGVDNAGERMKNAVQDARQEAVQAADKAKEAVEENGLGEKLRRGADRAVDAVGDAAESVREGAESAGDAVRKKVTEWVSPEQKPSKDAVSVLRELIEKQNK
jgi:hypothetical protein